MRPGAHKSAAQVLEVCELDLQGAFPRPRALAKDVQNQTGSVDDLAAPSLLQIALLHGAEWRIHHRYHHLIVSNRASYLRGLTLPE